MTKQPNGCQAETRALTKKRFLVCPLSPQTALRKNKQTGKEKKKQKKGRERQEPPGTRHPLFPRPSPLGATAAARCNVDRFPRYAFSPSASQWPPSGNILLFWLVWALLDTELARDGAPLGHRGHSSQSPQGMMGESTHKARLIQARVWIGTTRRSSGS